MCIWYIGYGSSSMGFMYGWIFGHFVSLRTSLRSDQQEGTSGDTPQAHFKTT